MIRIVWLLLLWGCDDRVAGTADGAASLQPTDSCKRYLSCLLVVAPQSYGAALVLYGDGSECWKTAEQAGNCGIACDSSFDDISAQCTCDDTTCMAKNPTTTCSDAAEPNDSLQAAKPVQATSLAICPATDHDWFVVPVSATGQNLEVVATGAAIAPTLSIRNAGGSAIANASPVGGLAIRAYAANVPAGTYYVEVWAADKTDYALSVTLTGP